MDSIRSAGLRLIAVFLSAYMLLSAGNASAAATWQDVRSSMVLRGIASNGTLYVGAAANGIWTSSDLKTWKQVTLPASAGVIYNDVLWDGSRFIAVGNGLISSIDGSTWTVGFASSSASVWNAIALSTGGSSSTYVVVGSDAGEVLRSTDGLSWTLVPTGFAVSSFSYLSSTNGPNLSLTGVASGGSGFVAMGYQYSTIGDAQSPNADILATSLDGVTWSPATVPSNPNGLFDFGAQNNVAWGAGFYVAGGSTGVYTSPDGTNWTLENFPAPSGGGTNEWLLTRIQYSNGQFIGVGEDLNSGSYAAFTSLTGSTWTEHTVATAQPSFQGLDAIVPFSTGYAVGGDYTVYTSTDLSIWTQAASTPETANTGCIMAANGKFLILGDGGSLSSSDGTAWPSSLDRGSGTFLQEEGDGQGCAAFGNGLFVVIEFGFDMAYSTDAVNWHATGPLSSQFTTLSAVAWMGNEFVMVGDLNQGLAAGFTPVVETSTDAKIWTEVSTTGLPAGVQQFGSMDNLGTGLVYTNGELVAWGLYNSGVPFIAVSSDAKTWETASLFSAGDTISAVAFGGGKYLALGYDASGNTLAASSPDGLHWTQISGVETGIHAHWGTLIWGNDEFVAGGRNLDTTQGLIINSSDGTKWSATTLGSGEEIGGLAWNGSSYVAVSFQDVFEYTPPSSGSGGGTSGGGGSGGGSGSGKSSGGGGGAFDMLALSLLSGLAIRRRSRWMSL